MKNLVITAVSTTFLVITAAPALALNTRSFVSIAGDDNNPCTASLPCRTFQRAHDQTQSGGQITPATPGGYGALTITKSIKILNRGGGAVGIFVPAGGNGITINAGANDQITIDGLSIDGLGLDGTNGILVNFAGGVAILNSSITDMRSSTGAAGNGVFINVANGGVNFVISDSYFAATQDGVQIAGGAAYSGTIQKSVFRANSGGFVLQPGTGQSKVTVDDVTFTGNNIGGILQNGNAASSIYVTRCEFTANAVGVASDHLGFLYTNGDNRFNGSGNAGNQDFFGNVGLD